MGNIMDRCENRVLGDPRFRVPDPLNWLETLQTEAPGVPGTPHYSVFEPLYLPAGSKT